jgi:hypothetical protein
MGPSMLGLELKVPCLECITVVNWSTGAGIAVGCTVCMPERGAPGVMDGFGRRQLSHHLSVPLPCTLPNRPVLLVD